MLSAWVASRGVVVSCGVILFIFDVEESNVQHNDSPKPIQASTPVVQASGQHDLAATTEREAGIDSSQHELRRLKSYSESLKQECERLRSQLLTELSAQRKELETKAAKEHRNQEREIQRLNEQLKSAECALKEKKELADKVEALESQLAEATSLKPDENPLCKRVAELEGELEIAKAHEMEKQELLLRLSELEQNAEVPTHLFCLVFIQACRRVWHQRRRRILCRRRLKR